MLSKLLLTFGLCLGTGAVLLADEPATEQKSESSRQAAEETFQKQLNNAVLVGHFSLDDQPDSSGKPERYEIRSISKVKENLWMFQTRIKYGEVDAVVPILVPIEWAGDTPMVSLTDFTIPGMGTFTCRVLFHGDRYAGTWQHGPKGGHMWGKIEKGEEGSTEPKKSSRPRKTE